MLDVFDKAPKVELHLHLEGATPIETLYELVEGYGDPEIHDIDDLKRRFVYRDFPHFIDTWYWMTRFLRSGADFRRVARSVAESLADQNIIYAETAVSPADFARHGLSVGEILMAVRSGLDEVDDVEVGLIVDLVRDTGPERALATVNEVGEVAADAGVVGITLGGSEQTYPPDLFVDSYRVAGDAGLGLTAHAGEAAGPESVWSALRELRVGRLGHGIRSIEDPGLMELLIAEQIPLEVCPSSNLRTGVVDTWEDHPVFRLLEAGTNVSISSDDPLFFANSVAGDLRELSQRSEIDLERLTLNAAHAAFASDGVKERIVHEVAGWWGSR